MIHHIPSARLLPITIGVMSALLAVKSVALVRAVAMPVRQPSALMVASAQAASAEHAGEKSADKAAAGKPPSEKPAAEKASAGKPSAEKPGAEGPAATAHGAAPAETPAAAASTALPAEPPIDQNERAVLLELRQRRKELDARETSLSARESMLAAADQKLAGRVTELMTLQKRLEVLEAGREQREEASWQGLVKVYETMKPRDAATIFNDLAQPVLLNVLDRMKDSKAATVLAAMNPDKARDITAQLAQLRTQRNAPLDAATPAAPAPPATPPKASKAPG